MYEATQELFDLQEKKKNGGSFGESSCWHNPSSSLNASMSSGTVASGNVDLTLFNDLVEIVPLVQSLIDRKPNTSFTRRGSITYTKMPSRESLYKKTSRNAAQSIASKKHRDQNKNVNGSQDGFSMISSRSSQTEEDKEELVALREQVDNLQKKLLEKDELMKEIETLKNETVTIYAELDEIKMETAEKDSLLKSTQVQLSETKVKLADKQAAVERLEWEAASSIKKVEKLQEDLEVVQGEISSFMQFVQDLTKSDFRGSAEDYDVIPYLRDQNVELDYLNETEMLKLEEAREAYIAAVAAAKESQDEESIFAAATARSYLQSLVLRTKHEF